MIKRLKKQLQVEIDTAFLYRKLSENTPEDSLAGIYRSMSEIEDTHAAKVLANLRLEDKTAVLPRPSMRARTQVTLTRIFGWNIVLSTLFETEKNIAQSAVKNKKHTGGAFTGGELNHYRILDNLYSSSGGMEGGILAKAEQKHRSVGGNALRAAVLGANDGLVTNLSVIMGVAGAIQGNATIIIAGIAALLAGAFSMALGEWLSVQSSHELNQRQMDIEMTEMENSPEEELMELSLIYQSKGLTREKAGDMAKEVFANKESAIDTLVKEELGLDSKDPGGSAWEAAITSFILFAIGAVIPLLPFLLPRIHYPVWISLGLSTIGLFILGSSITLYTGKNAWFSGFRQVIFGLGAAAVTYSIGRLLGVSLMP
jgi:vacuolar iron transporter family protein